MAEGVLCLGHADGQLVEAHVRVLLNLSLGLWQVLHTGGLVALLGDDLDLGLLILGRVWARSVGILWTSSSTQSGLAAFLCDDHDLGWGGDDLCVWGSVGKV